MVRMVKQQSAAIFKRPCLLFKYFNGYLQIGPIGVLASRATLPFSGFLTRGFDYEYTAIKTGSAAVSNSLSGNQTDKTLRTALRESDSLWLPEGPWSENATLLLEKGKELLMASFVVSTFNRLAQTL